MKKIVELDSIQKKFKEKVIFDSFSCTIYENEFVAIIKESSMASIIGVNELMFASKVVVGSTYRGLEPYIVAAGFYFIMTFTLGRIISLIERRMKKSDSR